MRRRVFISMLVLLLAILSVQAQNGTSQPRTTSSKSRLVVFVVGMGNHQIEDYLSSLIGNELARGGNYEIIPRDEALKQKLAELREYEDAGHIDDRELIEWGRQHNVSQLCLVRAIYLGEYLFSVQLTDIKSNRLLNSAEYSIPTASGDNLKKAASAIAAQL